MQQPISQKFNPVNFYLGFSGRINRKQFWLYGYLPMVALSVVASVITAFVFSLAFSGSIEGALVTIIILLCALLVFYVVMLWVSLAIQIKRWHDRDKSAWWIFIGLIPIAGPIWVLIELGFLPGTPSENLYGLVP